MENLKIKGWIGSNNQMEHTNLGGYLLTTEWDFTQFDDAPKRIEGQTAIQHQVDLAKALQAVLNAAHQLGDVEHTSDWDPILLIKLRNGETIESESHYYQINEVTDKALFIEAPSRQDYKEWEEKEPLKYYVPDIGKMLPNLVIPIEDIALITINAQ